MYMNRSIALLRLLLQCLLIDTLADGNYSSIKASPPLAGTARRDSDPAPSQLVSSCSHADAPSVSTFLRR